jgi:hypothetical protein
MLKIGQAILYRMEYQYEGIIEQIYTYEQAKIPTCLICGSSDTARVIPGVIGRTISIAAATSKVKLLLNQSDSEIYFCNQCGSFFDR